MRKCHKNTLTSLTGASFNNFLDAIDGSYCTFEGGDNYTVDSQYPDPYGGGYEGKSSSLLDRKYNKLG
jgi:hypothetical protein